MRLRTKFAVVLLVFAIVLSISVYGGLELYKQRLVDDAQREVNETASLTANQIDASIEQQRDFIGFVASRPKASRFNESDEYLRELVDNSRFLSAQLIAANGTIIDFHGDISPDVRHDSIGQNVADRPYVRHALIGEVYMTEPEYVNATDKYLVIISAPVFDDRVITGVLAAAIYVDRHSFFDAIGPVETTGQAVLVANDDTVLYPAQASYPQNITAVATVQSTGWTVAVMQDRSPLLSQLQDLAIAQGIGLFVVLFVVVGYGVWEYRTTLAQTEELLDGFAALGRGEFDHTLSLSAAEEWTQISSGFNALATELKQRDEELQRREQRLEVLNRALRHNLRNHTSVILGYAETVRDRATDEAVVEPVEDLIGTAMDLIDLSDKARQIEAAMDTTSPYGERTPLELVSIVHDVVDNIADRYPEVDIIIDTPEQAWVTAIPAIEMALENVVENACKHNEGPDPRVDISIITDDDSGVEVQIEDNGPGIPKRERDVIAEGRETALEHGSGLGLWLVHWTMERSQGELRFGDPASAGTTVTLEFRRPSTDDHPELRAEDHGSPAGTDDSATVDAAEPDGGDRRVD